MFTLSLILAIISLVSDRVSSLKSLRSKNEFAQQFDQQLISLAQELKLFPLSITGPLTSGWVTIQYYADITCATEYFSSSIQLGVCASFQPGSYVIYSADESSTLSLYQNLYSDSLCTVSTTSSTLSFTQACTATGASGGASTSVSYSPQSPSTVNTQLVTEYLVSSTCSGVVIGQDSFFPNCQGGTTGKIGYYCNGDSLVTSNYSAPGCSGTVVVTTTTIANTCTYSSQTYWSGYTYTYCSTGGIPAPTGPTPSPTLAPTALATNPSAAPSAAPVSSGGSDSCFSGYETITMESGETKLISEVVVGDRVLAFSTKTNSAVFSEVVSVPHAANNVDTTFAEIATANSNIKMTPAHLLPAGTCGALSLMQAGEVKVGDCIYTVSGEQVVTGVSKVQEKGIYTIVTNEEYVIVSGVIASPFAVNHFAANKFYNIHRALYNFAPYAMKSTFLAISFGIAKQVANIYSFV